MVVKERVEGDLDYIVDRLIEKDIFSIQIKVSPQFRAKFHNQSLC